MKNNIFKVVSLLLIGTFLSGQISTGFAYDNLAVSVASGDIDPERARRVQKDIARDAKPGSIGNGKPLVALLKGREGLPERIPLSKNTADAVYRVRNAIEIGIRLYITNEARIPGEHAVRAKQGFEKLIMLQERLTQQLYLYNANRDGAEDYLLGFNFEEEVGLSIELIRQLYSISPKRLAQYIYHECVPERQVIVDAEAGEVNREDHRVVYNKIQTAIFTQEEVAELGRNFRNFITTGSVFEESEPQKLQTLTLPDLSGDFSDKARARQPIYLPEQEEELLAKTAEAASREKTEIRGALEEIAENNKCNFNMDVLPLIAIMLTEKIITPKNFEQVVTLIGQTTYVAPISGRDDTLSKIWARNKHRRTKSIALLGLIRSGATNNDVKSIYDTAVLFDVIDTYGIFQEREWFGDAYTGDYHTVLSSPYEELILFADAIQTGAVNSSFASLSLLTTIATCAKGHTKPAYAALVFIGKEYGDSVDDAFVKVIAENITKRTIYEATTESRREYMKALSGEFLAPYIRSLLSQDKIKLVNKIGAASGRRALRVSTDLQEIAKKNNCILTDDILPLISPLIEWESITRENYSDMLSLVDAVTRERSIFKLTVWTPAIIREPGKLLTYAFDGKKHRRDEQNRFKASKRNAFLALAKARRFEENDLQEIAELFDSIDKNCVRTDRVFMGDSYTGDYQTTVVSPYDNIGVLANAVRKEDIHPAFLKTSLLKTVSESSGRHAEPASKVLTNLGIELGGNANDERISEFEANVRGVARRQKKGKPVVDYLESLCEIERQIKEATYNANALKVNLYHLFSQNPDVTYVAAVDTDISKEHRGPLTPIYTALDQLGGASTGEPLIPNLRCVRGSGKSGELMKRLKKVYDDQDLNAAPETTFMVARQANVIDMETGVFDAIKGKAWITAIDDKEPNYSYIPIFEAVTLSAMSCFGADIDSIKRFYDAISAEPIAAELLGRYIETRIIYLLPKTAPMDPNELGERNDIMASIHLSV
jgi:hypothetical protein